VNFSGRETLFLFTEFVGGGGQQEWRLVCMNMLYFDLLGLL
jgi:hypothetical protein